MNKQLQLRKNKLAIRAFLRTEVWSDEKLCALLAHAHDKLSMWSCCCLIGVATANHALKGEIDIFHCIREAHYQDARVLPLAEAAELAFAALGGNNTTNATCDPPGADSVRRRLIVPIIRAELCRRDRLRAAERTAQESRERALLALAHPGRMGLDVGDVEMLSGMAAPESDLAAILMRGATVTMREGE